MDFFSVVTLFVGRGPLVAVVAVVMALVVVVLSCWEEVGKRVVVTEGRVRELGRADIEDCWGMRVCGGRRRLTAYDAA